MKICIRNSEAMVLSQNVGMFLLGEVRDPSLEKGFKYLGILEYSRVMNKESMIGRSGQHQCSVTVPV